MQHRISTGALAFAFAALIAPASADTAFPEPAVVRVPTTFGAPARNVAPPAFTPNARMTNADRYRIDEAKRANRAAREAAFIKKFGAGKAVTLRPRRY